MKRIILSFVGLCALGFTSLGQATQQHTFDPQNARDGESVEYCLQHKKHAELSQNSAYLQSILQDNLIRQQEAIQNAGNEPEATTYYIPIVFHLLHNGGAELISDDQILDAFAILNRDYDLQNADAANVVNAFNASNGAATAIPTDADIEFVLATKAPNGTCFSGITHTVSSQTSSGNGTQQINAIRNGNDVYNGEWAGNKYLNIFICEDIGGAAGYTMLPSNWVGTGMENGIFILHNYIGSIGTSSSGSSRALTHEVGHWLNLDHVWGGSNNPGLSTNCNDDDQVNDTPECKGSTSCALTSNTCNGDNSYWGFDQIDNVENYMDYSYCSKMFTPGQVARMRAALNSSVGGRNNIKTTTNLTATGADGNLYLCKAQFTANRTTICAGETVDFSDLSYNVVNGWTWTFTGGAPANSSAQNPSVTYDTPGLYTVTLAATDGNTNDSESKTAYIRVLPDAGTIPLIEGFESFSTLDAIQEWEVIDYGNNAKFELSTDAAHSGTKSAKLPNFGQSAGNVDELVSTPVDLSGVTSQTGMTLSFRYAYSKRSASNEEYLKVYVSGDCGEVWAPRKTLFGDLLGTNVTNSAWTPGASDWVTVHMTNVTSNYWVDNFRYKFEFQSDGGNNLYIDDINIYTGSPSDAIVVGLEENESFTRLTVFPNPTEGELTVRFDVAAAQAMNLEVVDITGKVIQSNTVQALSGTNAVVLGTESLASGMYFLNVKGGASSQAIQFVVK